ncbi:MAG: hypothetical protein JRI23_14235, partial [Deltaproteobacteria bacterium]|nr:hypothetical protein [Deltaproteobacteria bacterium]MBW2532903.1 hypothetical protein [Deltaproteobacteria bacterium]
MHENREAVRQLALAAHVGEGHRRWRWLLGVLAAMAVTVAPAFGWAQPAADEATVVEDPAPADGELYEETDPRALSDFRGTLDPHGRWVDHPDYGTVWVPSVVVVGKDFVPYKSAGRWAVTEGGDWVWVSDYDWGHVVFHYGRWVWVEDLGWAWIPGRRYAPSWVVWRVGEPGWDYVGWAPMGPSYVWVDGVAVTYTGVAVLPFWFVPTVWFFHPYWYHHVIYDPYRVHLIAGHTHIHHGHYYGHHHGHYYGHSRRPAHRPARPGVGGSSGG